MTEVKQVNKGNEAGVIDTPALTPPTAKAEVKSTPVDDGYRTHFGKRVKLGSRKVTIKLVSKFSILPKDAAAKFIRDEVTKKIGCTWKAGTRDIIRGLTREEEIFYLPRLLGVRLESEQWNDKVLQHWANFTIDVPNDEVGLELEAGFREITTSTGKTVEPINLEDYMRFNFCREHSSVATEPDQIDNTFMYTYYMVDKQKEEVIKEQQFVLRQEVDKKFIRLIQSTDPGDSLKIDWILETSGGSTGAGISVTGLTKIQKQMELEEMKKRDLSRFDEILKDEFLETKALIRSAIATGSLIQEGNSYFLDNKVIGSSLKQAVGYLKSPENQLDRLKIQERIKEFKK
jgi:hypothetical protein